MPQDGTAITQVFIMVAENPVPPSQVVPLIASRLRECCGDFSFKVLAENNVNATDEFKNDVNGFLYWYPKTTTDADLYLQKFSQDNPLDGWANVSTLTGSSTYGTDKPFDFFINDAGERFIGYQLKWNKVLAAVGLGAGSYRVKSVSSSFFGEKVDYSFEYCLNEFSAERAEGTVKIEYNLNAITGDRNDDLKSKDFGQINWYNSMRVKAKFGYPKADYEETRTKLNEKGEFIFTEDKQNPSFILKTKPVFYAFHDIMRTDVMQADAVYMTDYNSSNPGTFIRKAVRKKSGYDPKWIEESKLATVDVEWFQTYNNLDKLRC